MPVVFDEFSGSPEKQFNRGKPVITRRGKIAWTDIAEFENELIPPSITTGGSSTVFPGAAYPGDPAYRVVDYTIKPFQGEASATTTANIYGVNAYEFAEVTITYEVPVFDQSGDGQQNQEIDPVPLLKHSGSGGGQFITIPADGWRWSTGVPVPDDVPIGIFVGTTQHSVTWPSVVSPNWDALEANKGKVNNAPFTLRGYEYPAETLLYLAYDFEREILSDGSRAWSITMHFESKQVVDGLSSGSGGQPSGIGGHNHFWRRDRKSFLRIDNGEEDPDTNSVYKRFDFNTLFTSG